RLERAVFGRERLGERERSGAHRAVAPRERVRLGGSRHGRHEPIQATPMRREGPAVQAEYVEVARARAMPGLRLALTRGVPGPWGEAAKGIFHAKKISFVRVAQNAGADNDALFAWTGHRNAPIAVYDDEPPRTTWAEI